MKSMKNDDGGEDRNLGGRRRLGGEGQRGHARLAVQHLLLGVGVGEAQLCRQLPPLLPRARQGGQQIIYGN